MRTWLGIGSFNWQRFVGQPLWLQITGWIGLAALAILFLILNSFLACYVHAMVERPEALEGFPAAYPVIDFLLRWAGWLSLVVVSAQLLLHNPFRANPFLPPGVISRLLLLKPLWAACMASLILFVTYTQVSIFIQLQWFAFIVILPGIILGYLAFYYHFNNRLPYVIIDNWRPPPRYVDARNAIAGLFTVTVSLATLMLNIHYGAQVALDSHLSMMLFLLYAASYLSLLFIYPWDGSSSLIWITRYRRLGFSIAAVVWLISVGSIIVITFRMQGEQIPVPPQLLFVGACLHLMMSGLAAAYECLNEYVIRQRLRLGSLRPSKDSNVLQ